MSVDNLGGLHTLEEVLEWANPDYELVRVLVQDEFTHDVVFGAPDSGSFVVFDTT